MNAKDQAYADAVRRHVDRLRAATAETLRQMPAFFEARCESEPALPPVHIYREALPGGRLLIAVQAKRDILLGYGHMFVEGLILEPDGARSVPKPEELYDYT